MRPLILHASALTDSEYTLYTTSLCDLAGEDDEARSHSHDDSYYAALQISVREARAWVRGRYTDLSPANVDAVLKLFCPNLGVADVLSGGQFFAALRLVTHLRHGHPLDGSLVFVQAHPDDALPKPQPQPPAPSNNNAIPTPTDSRRSSREVSSSDAPLVDLGPVGSPAPPPPRSTTSGAPPPPPPKPLPATHSSSTTNPFINRAKSHDPQPPASLRSRQTQSPLPPLPPRKSNAPPPPPPRHSSIASPNTPTFPPSATSPAFAFWHNHSLSSSGTPTNPNVLIQQSLQAGRIAQSLKKAEEKLEKERVLEVLKSSSAPGGARTRTRSESPSKEYSMPPNSAMTPITKSRSPSSAVGSASSGSTDRRGSSATVTSKGPALPPRRRASPPLSAASTRSFEQVAHASIPLSARRSATTSSRDGDSIKERLCTPPPQHPDLLPQPPPLPPAHPVRKPHPPPPPSTAPDTNTDLEASPGGRVYRSKSMHYPQPPLPPPRRRRPESVQFGTLSLRDRSPSPSYTDHSSRSVNTAFSSPASIPTRGHGTMSRHLSLSMQSSRRSESGLGSTAGPGTQGAAPKEPLANIRSTLMNLQPKLDAARYKVEGGLSRRGFVNHGRESLWHEEGEEGLMAEPDGIGENSTGVSADESDDGGVGQDPGTDGSADEKGRWDGNRSRNGGLWEDERGRGRSTSAGGELRERRMKPWEVERDDMKWPAGEGWKPL